MRDQAERSRDEAEQLRALFTAMGAPDRVGAPGFRFPRGHAPVPLPELGGRWAALLRGTRSLLVGRRVTAYQRRAAQAGRGDRKAQPAASPARFRTGLPAALARLWRSRAGLVTAGAALLLFTAAVLALLLRDARLSPERWTDERPVARADVPAASDPFAADRAIAADLLAAREAEARAATAVSPAAPVEAAARPAPREARRPREVAAVAPAARTRPLRATADEPAARTAASRAPSRRAAVVRATPAPTPALRPSAPVLAARATFLPTPAAAVPASANGASDDPTSRTDRSLRATRQDATDAIRAIRLR